VPLLSAGDYAAVHDWGSEFSEPDLDPKLPFVMREECESVGSLTRFFSVPTGETLSDPAWRPAPNDRAADFVREFSHLPVPEDPRVFGRDGSNPYYDLLYWVSKRTRPTLTVELGTCTGGSTSNLAARSIGKVVSIDIELRPDARERLAAFENLEQIQADTRDPEVAKTVAAKGPIDLLFIDTEHSADQVSAELDFFGPLVRQGGLMFFDDIRINPGMSAWWDALPEEKLELPDMHWSGFGVVFR